MKQGHSTRKQLCKKGPWGPDGQQVEHQPAIGLCSKGQQHSGLH